MPTIDIHRHIGGFLLRVQPDFAEIISMQRDRQRTDWRHRLEHLMQTLCDPHAAAMNADDSSFVRERADPRGKSD